MGRGEARFQFLILDDPALLQIDQQHAAGLEPPLGDDLFFRHRQNAGFGRHDDQIVGSDDEAGRTQAIAVQGRANLRSFELKRSDTSQHLFTILHYYDYINNNAYEFGGQSVSLMYLRRSQRSERSALLWNAAGSFMMMGAVNSEGAHLAEIPGVRERLREYDFGSGGGVRGGVQFLRDGYRWVEASYRFQYLNTLNGSNANGEDADHIIQKVRVRAMIPLGVGRWGAGAEYELHLRNSFFSVEGVDDVRQRNPQYRFFLTWNPTRAPSGG